MFNAETWHHNWNMKKILLKKYYLGQMIYQCPIQYIAIVSIVFNIDHRDQKPTLLTNKRSNSKDHFEYNGLFMTCYITFLVTMWCKINACISVGNCRSQLLIRKLMIKYQLIKPFTWKRTRKKLSNTHV